MNRVRLTHCGYNGAGAKTDWVSHEVSPRCGKAVAARPGVDAAFPHPVSCDKESRRVGRDGHGAWACPDRPAVSSEEADRYHAMVVPVPGFGSRRGDADHERPALCDTQASRRLLGCQRIGRPHTAWSRETLGIPSLMLSAPT